MDYIFHEKQEGSLCAQHCLNALLQGAYFNAVDLANIGHQMDEAERARMAEGGVHSADYSSFLTRPSSNVDDSGFFSVQVIEEALKNVGLHLVRFDSPNALAARGNPGMCQAYICNLMEHWLTIRKIGSQWFNLNSLLSAPHLLSDTYLAMFLEQLSTEGYSIFVVEGDLPQCQAHDILLAQPAVQHVPPPLLADLEDPTDEPSHSTYSRGQCTTEADGLSEALAASRQEALAAERKQLQAALDASRVTEDDSIQQALADSRHHVPPHVAGTGTGGVAVSAALTQPTGAPSATLPVESAEVLRQKRLAFFDRSQHSGTGDGQQPSTQDSKPSIDNSSVTTAPDVITINEEEAFDPEPVGLDDLTEEEQLELAIAMSHSQQQ